MILFDYDISGIKSRRREMSLKHALCMALTGLVVMAFASTTESTDFMVNEEDYPGAFKQDKSSVAYDGQGNYVVCWRDFRKGLAWVYFQRFDAAGQPLGENKEVAAVNSGTGDPVPVVAMNQSGEFVIVYRQSFSEIHLARYDASGNLLSPALQVSGIGLNIQFCHNFGIAMNDLGHITVIFRAKQSTEDNYQVIGQHIDFSYGPVGQNFVIGEAWEPDYDTPPKVAIGNGDHVFCVWAGNDMGKIHIAFNSGAYPDPLILPETVIDTSYEVPGEYRYDTEDPMLEIHPGGIACLLWSGTYWDEIGYHAYSYRCDTTFIRMIDISGALLVERHGVLENTATTGSGSHSDIAASGSGFSIVGRIWPDKFYLHEFDLDGLAPNPPTTIVPDDSGNYHNNLMIAPISDNSLALTWRSSSGSSAAGDVVTQGFERDGTGLFDLRRVHDDVGAAQNFPVTAFDSSGGFIVLWIDSRESYSGDVWGQRYDADGNPMGVNFKINDDAPGVGGCSQLEVSSNGLDRAVAIWVRNTTAGGRSVVFQVLDGVDFNPTGPNVTVLTHITSFRYYWPDVAVALDRSMVLTWRQQETDSYVTGTYIAAYSADIENVSGIFNINEAAGQEIGMGLDGLLFDYAPRIAMRPDGGFAIAWIEMRDQAWTFWDDYFIVAQFFDSPWSPLGGNVLVSETLNGVVNSGNEEIPPDIAVNEFGEYAIAWTGGSNQDYLGLWTRIFNSTGVPLSPQVQYYDHEDFFHYPSARVAAGPNHEFLGIWYSVGDADEEIYAQRFGSSGDLLDEPMLINSDLSGERQSYPVAATGCSQLVIVWEDYREGYNNPDIFARRTSWGIVNCGDANGDGDVNVGDAVYIINCVFKGGPAPDPIEAGDANCDGDCNIGDAVYLISHAFKGGPAPCADCD
ncbi:MAG: dockerin type I repeat-containing protein [candidate division Zixibacteria bacterium]